MSNNVNLKEQALELSVQLLLKIITSSGMDLDRIKEECTNIIINESEDNISSDLKIATVHHLGKLISQEKRTKSSNYSLGSTSKIPHHIFENLHSSESEGDGISLKLDGSQSNNLTMKDITSKKSKGCGIVIDYGAKPKTNVELILDAVKDKLPNEIKLEEIAPLIKDVLDSKSPDEAKQKIDTSTLSSKFKEPALWISFGNLLIQLVRPLLG
ncbi:Uncharacterised protein [Acinetobacter baumannii]|uniref:hypothetical protein n=1 Tax=Acinetobacter baumannii TaxID=470 RepID=UPI000DE77123|nr:hypothetical protein [Acinetobacter baumannii]MCG6602168.1 hypothetical protein [Acinetobacter baumannii]MDH2645566.1 hypothetical protein [Acinetobacter baumannii]QBY13588.1 hypothetical protein E4664_05685 [Acinetobacter baumannii]SSR21845.1 Uncharacterised protein [Acinetobacter baumannii]SSS36309.1 Uncharacterised protein [Acinetobacter baumannii]